MISDRTKSMLWIFLTLNLFAFALGDPPIDTPSRCANARQPLHGDVKCCFDTGGIPDDFTSGGKSSKSGGSSKGPDVYTCSYSCDKGYKLNGPSVLECPIGAVTDNPTCTLVECNTLPTIDHGALNCTNGFLYGSKCQYSCARGFNTSGGSNILTCGNDGLWKGAVPSCQAVQCPPLSDPSHGTITCPNGRIFGEDCRYTCDDRYVLDGSPVATCSIGGQWIGKTPTCKLGECVPLPLLTYGSLTCTDGWDRFSRCYYSCHEGFSLTGGNFILTCASNGFWRGDIPTCEQDWFAITPANTTDQLCHCGIPPPDNLPDFPFPFEKDKPYTTAPPTSTSSTGITANGTQATTFQTTTGIGTSTEFDYYTSPGNTGTDFAIYDMMEDPNGPSSINRAHGGGAGSDANPGNGGIGTAGIVSIIAVIAICFVVGVALIFVRIRGGNVGYSSV